MNDPKRIGRFRILERLGAGGMGVVYKAHDPTLDRIVALKVLLPDQLERPVSRERLMREARAAAALNHPHIATIYEVGVSDDIDWIAMEHIDGVPLRQRIKRLRLSTETALAWALQICDALGEAHARGIVHRDIKSANVMVTPRHDVKVLDFGLALVQPWFAAADGARLTESNVVVGTIDYMAPEILRGEQATPRSDVFSLGTLLYEMLQGRPPFAGRTPAIVMNAILSSEPAPISQVVDDLPSGLDTVIARAICKDPSMRQASARELWRELHAVHTAWQTLDPHAHEALSEVTGKIPHNLPAPVTRFVGRRRELAELASLQLQHRLFTITGPGGGGKTRLALEHVRRVLERFPGGVYFVDLAPHTDAKEVVQSVARVIDVRETSGRDLLDVLIERLRRRRVLLVLDNCEHLIDASATLTARLLQDCSELHIVATSQERLDVPGELVWQVPPLSMPKSQDQSLEKMLESSAVQLFVDRATAVKSSFILTAQTAPFVVQICRRLDAIPLAIELAAARVRILTVEQILARLEDRFRLLSGGGRTVMARQQTLRGTVEWSVDLLKEEERTVLRRISVFSGGATLDAAETVCGRDGIEAIEVLDYLTRLIDKSLLAVEESRDGQRYVQLQTLREHGAELLASAGEENSVRTAHASYYLELAERAAPELTGAEQAAWLDRLELESSNLRQALLWSARREPHRALRLGASLWRFWFVRGELTEGRGLLRKALAAPRDVDADGGIARAQALHGAGVLANDQGDYAAAREAFDACLEIRRQLADRAGVAQTLTALGIAARDQGDYETANRLLEEGLSIHREIDDASGVAMSIHALGITAHREGDCDAAWSLFEEGLEIRRKLRDRRGIAALLAHLGAVAYDQSRYDEAQRLLEEALAIFRELGSKRGILWALMHLGGVSQQRGDSDRAFAQQRESLQLCAELGDRHYMARSLEWIAGLEAACGRPERALRLLGAAAALRQEIGSPLTPLERKVVDADASRARDLIDEAQAHQLLAEGARMEPPDAIREALGSRR
ncbi:MAG: tetratricopeptide repeat protein [Candidatus Latescibacterota bacterium]|nr:MAG: tetratricopeptide repeat protein [Candidatus Latescibacterota bacterium]